MTIDLTVPGIGVGRAFGSCGELLQGVTEQNRHFLVTLPIRRGTVAVFEPSEHDIAVVPADKSKAHRLASAMLARSTVLCGGRLTLHSELPEGKGLASSTADLVATARAIADAEGRAVPLGELEADLRAIEPSDGVMYPGTVAYLHREVRLLAPLGTLPALTIVTGDEGGSVDTVEFNRNEPRFSPADKREFDRLLGELGAAIAHGDVATIGAVATRSAVLSAATRDRPHLDATILAARAIGAAGVVVAHSGTTTGILLADTDPRLREQVLAAQQICADFARSVTVHHSWRPGVHAEQRVSTVDHPHLLTIPRTESTPR
ncbi:GHMP family kinase ATP-binding protein [Nocardia sp. FBN12]|uniref:GHMP family kinase ATP-binding protein n=1 Tax=Nocardia sp. FBN12 TaxID=3419766 RepID=UPI003D08DAD8